MFRMALYIWTSTAKWTGKQDWRSCVAGVHVSQERALYCSNTNLSLRNTEFLHTPTHLYLLGKPVIFFYSQYWFRILFPCWIIVNSLFWLKLYYITAIKIIFSLINQFQMKYLQSSCKIKLISYCYTFMKLFLIYIFILFFHNQK